jgi:hypothetical protein
MTVMMIMTMMGVMTTTMTMIGRGSKLVSWRPRGSGGQVGQISHLIDVAGQGGEGGIV